MSAGRPADPERTDPSRAPDHAAAWVRARPAPPSEPVLAEILARLSAPGPGEASVAGRLADAGLRTLEAVAAGEGGRSSAVALLAADALITYAVEAAAEQGEEELDRLLDSLGLDRFGTLLPGENR